MPPNAFCGKIGALFLTISLKYQFNRVILRTILKKLKSVKIRILVSILCLVTNLHLKAQEKLNPSLKPIEVQQQFLRVRFVYDRQLIDNPLALQIPLLQSHDPEVSLNFLKYKSQRKASNMIGIIPAGVSLYAIFYREKVSDGFYWSIVGSSFLLRTYLNIRATKHLTTAIGRYNSLLPNQVGIQFEPLPDNQQVLGLTFTKNF